MTKEVVLQMIWDRHFSLYGSMEKDLDDICEDIYNEVFVPLLEKARQERAKEIYITGKYYYAKHSPMERQLSDFLANIKETYGVEVEDNGN